MKYLLLLIIKLYWLIPAKKRRRCLFKKSCSHFVFEATKNHGFSTGLQALQYRIKNCRQGSILYIHPYTGRTELILPNKDIITEEDIAENIFR